MKSVEKSDPYIFHNRVSRPLPLAVRSSELESMFHQVVNILSTYPHYSQFIHCFLFISCAYCHSVPKMGVKCSEVVDNFTRRRNQTYNIITIRFLLQLSYILFIIAIILHICYLLNTLHNYYIIVTYCISLHIAYMIITYCSNVI